MMMLCYIYQVQKTNICTRSVIETLVQGAKFIQTRRYHYQDAIIDFVLVSSLLTCSSVFIADFEQAKDCWKSLLWHSIYIGAERRHRSTVGIVNFECITTSSIVSTVGFKHDFIFWVFDFYISIVFRLR